jgi:putative membrane protein|eukprot:Transcript_21520.p4 GENE.Transcript_21520~~Transcript_21520.p4  ORF type:complete len:95 (+),score=40.67 Transcript_21520:986-1270(+)
MERIISTPLSPTYLRHISRGLVAWLMMLPCGLIGGGCTTLFKLCLVEAAISYIMLGIDEIGIQIEQPFDVLPLHAIATVLTKDVADELLAEDRD